MLCQLLLPSKVNHLLYMYLPLFWFLSHQVIRALSRGSCSGQRVLIIICFIHSVISVYVPIPVSQFISFSFSPLASIRLFSMSLCLFLLLNKIINQVNHHRQMAYCTRKTFRLITQCLMILTQMNQDLDKVIKSDCVFF